LIVLSRKDMRPVEGASLEAISGEVRQELGKTDESGALSAVVGWLEREAKLDVVTKHPAWATSIRRLGPRRHGEVLILLDEPSEIRGTVVDASGIPVAGARVAAFPAVHAITHADQVSRIKMGGWSGAYAIADASGAFRLTGLSRGATHVLLAGGSTAVSQRNVATAGDPELVTVVVYEVVGAVVDLVTADGERVPQIDLPPHEGSFRYGPAVAPLGFAWMRQPVGVPPELALVGFDYRELVALGSSGGSSRWTIVGLEMHPELEEGTFVSFGMRYPGMDSVSRKLPLGRWLGGFPVHTIELRGEPCRAGDIVAQFELGPHPRCAVDHPYVPVARLALYPVSPDPRRPAEALYDVFDLAAPFTVRVLEGAYELELRGSALLPRLRWPESGAKKLVDVRSDEVLQITVDLSHLGSLEFFPADMNGIEFDGRLMLHLRQWGKVGDMPVTLDGPPYCYPFLQPGDYEVFVDYPEWASFVCEPSLVQVIPGRMAEAQIVFFE